MLQVLPVYLASKSGYNHTRDKNLVGDHMEISYDWITGIAMGIEYVEPFDDEPNTLIVDLVIIRLLIQW